MKCYSEIEQPVYSKEKNLPGKKKYTRLDSKLAHWSARLAAVESAMELKGFHLAAKL